MQRHADGVVAAHKSILLNAVLTIKQAKYEQPIFDMPASQLALLPKTKASLRRP
jgi:hypothetical protein